jgi:hypothetical protein
VSRETKTAFRVCDRGDDCDQRWRSARHGGTGGNVRRQVKKAFRPTDANPETSEEKEDFSDADRHAIDVIIGKQNADFVAGRNSSVRAHAVAISKRNNDRAAERNAATGIDGG